MDDGVVREMEVAVTGFYAAHTYLHNICRYWGKRKMHIINSRATTTSNDNKSEV